MKTRYADIPAFVTKDGSVIRELLHPAYHSVRNQSLAEATLAPGQRTTLHRHGISEEIYHVSAGTARMQLGSEVFDVQAGDTICIPPGTPHCITNTGTQPLCILCCCSPPYAHEDTELL